MRSHQSNHAAGAGLDAAAVADRRRRRRVPVLAGLVAVGMFAMAAAAATAWVDERSGTSTTLCAPQDVTEVVVAVDPTIAEPLQEATADLGRRPLPVGGCAVARIVAQDPLQTSSELSTLTIEQLPDLWVPDSSTWVDQVSSRTGSQELSLLSAGSLASSQLVVAVNKEVAAGNGWQAAPPSWEEALTSGRPVALPDLVGSAAGVSALTALRASVLEGSEPTAGEGSVALQAALTTVANAIDEVPSGENGLELAEQPGPQSPVVPISEQQWWLRYRGSQTVPTVAIRPRDGSVSLDYPVVRVVRDQLQDEAAVQGIIDVLRSRGGERAQVLGFAEPLSAPRTDGPLAGDEPSGAPLAAATPQDASPVLPPPSATQVETLRADLEQLTRPSRSLFLVDASVSMRAPTPAGTRAELARDAVKSSIALFNDRSAVGLWFFAVGMGGGGADWTEIDPVAPLGENDHRAAVLGGIDSLPARLTLGGTGLNDSVLAAVRRLRETYDPSAANVVILVTDGRNDDPDGMSLEALTATLAGENDPARPVRVVAVGLADDSDATALRAITDATGGVAYLADQPEDFQAVLFDALRRRA